MKNKSVVWLLKQLSMIILLCIFLNSLTYSQSHSEDSVVARIGTKEITIKNFLERSELTIRPANFKDRYITLNNLITEKILALEAEKDNQIVENQILNGKIKGIKEQAMRDKLYHEIALNKVKTDSAELVNTYRASVREYEVEFYMLKTKELASDISSILDTLPELKDDVFRELERVVEKKPVRKVNFKDKDDDVIIESLFSNPLDTGVVIGPLKLKNGGYILLKVLSWTDKPVIGIQEQNEQWEHVKQTLQGIKARKVWLAYQTVLMRDKKFEFDKNSFNTIADVAMQFYINRAEDGTANLTMQEVPDNIEISPDAAFVTVNGEIWTVNDFKREVLSHPLVFRTKYLDKNNFKREFQYAVVDMMRDYYLNLEAYKLSLDKSDEVNMTTSIWKDSFFATAEMDKVIKSALEQGMISRDDNYGMLKYKESYIRNLQKRYSGQININYNVFEKVSLTNIDFMALRPGVPYPNATPNFPMLISSDNLDYGNSYQDK